MKKVFLLLLFISGTIVAKAQKDVSGKFSTGINVGFSELDTKGFWGTYLSYGVDVSYLWIITPEFKIGFASGYQSQIVLISTDTFFFEDSKDFDFIPMVIQAHHKLISKLYGGINLGYAMGVQNEFSKSGTYIAPKLGMEFGKWDINLCYKGILNSHGNYQGINLGLAYMF